MTDYKGPVAMALQLDDAKLLLELLNHQFLSYEKPELVELVHKINKFVDSVEAENERTDI